MKTLFATAASVFVLGFAMPAMAQSSTSTSYQSGTGGQTIDVNQIGGGAANISNAYQGYYDPSSHDNEITVDQLGNGGTANTSTAFQDGSSHIAKASQNGVNGVNNTSTITQSGTDHYADVNQFGGGSGDSNGSTINQHGIHQSAEVIQADLFNDNVSLIDQYDKNNTARVEQGDLLGAPVDFNNNNISTILQNGDGNDAQVYQGGASVTSNISGVTQYGTDNSAIINQH